MVHLRRIFLIFPLLMNERGGGYTSLLLRILFIMLVPDTAVRNGLNTLIYLVINVCTLYAYAVKPTPTDTLWTWEILRPCSFSDG
jgi:hypothetical protein